MADSLLTSLLGMFDKSSLSGMAGTLGESEQSVSRGVQSSIAAVLGGLASKSEDPIALGKIVDLGTKVLPGDITWSSVANSISNPSSPLMSGGKRLLSALFGSSENVVTSAISGESGLRSNVTSTMMAMAAPMVMSFLGKRMRDEGMSMAGLGSLLQRERATIRAALPASLRDLFWPRTSMASTASPIVAQAAERERSSFSWLPILALALLVPFLFWLFSQGHRTITQQITPAPVGTANRVVADPGDVVKRKLPENVDLRFDTGSATLRPESQERLNNLAAELSAYPDSRAKVGGYTDNVGSAAGNLQLSQKRANSVVDELVRKGISSDRLTAEGYGQQDPIADNSTAEGRATNRRVSVGVTQQ
jgi:outer membrane protein OmpA-like peptidoglycan-associated protein